MTILGRIWRALVGRPRKDDRPSLIDDLRERDDVIAPHIGEAHLPIGVVIHALLISGVLLTSACSTYRDAKPEDVASRVEVKDSEFDSQIRFVGPPIRKGWNEQTTVRLRGWIDKSTKISSHQIYTRVWYNLSDWRFYRSASFKGGERVDLVEIDRDVNCSGGGGIVTCSYAEIIGVPISLDDLKGAQDTGLIVRLNARSGHETFIEIPAPYVKGYLAAVVLNIQH